MKSLLQKGLYISTHICVVGPLRARRIFGIKGASSSVWNWWFLAKANRPRAVDSGQWQPERANLISDEDSSELNGKS